MPLRPIRIEGDVAYIPLARGYEAVVDAADVPLVSGRVWNIQTTPWNIYAHCADRSTGRRRLIKLHRLLMGEPEGLEIDHIDGDGLNNRRSNLRCATTAQNQYNQRLAAHNTSGFKGVSWHKRDKAWTANIKFDGRKRFLGYFSTPEDAHAAYCRASAELHGEFGRVA